MGQNTVVKADGKLLIAGAFQEAGEEERFGVINPANQAVVGQRALGTEEDAKQAVEAARVAREDSDRMRVPRRA
ncbi:MAG: aldehyde dehydrogenase family protein [Thermoplasmata archaeon]